MSQDTIDLDSRRGAAGAMGAEMRRSAAAPVLAAHAASALDLAALERRIVNGPAESWAQAAEHAITLLTAYGKTTEARDGRRQGLIERTIADLERLSLPGAGDAGPLGLDAPVAFDPGDVVGPMPGYPGEIR
jgi:hypothetical protein